MKNTKFTIRISGKYKIVNGVVFRFQFDKSEEVLYLGATKCFSGWAVYSLESGKYLNIVSFYKKDISVMTGKRLLNCSRWSVLSDMEYSIGKADNINVDVIESLNKCKPVLYFPANNSEFERLLKNHWFDDTSRLGGITI